MGTGNLKPTDTFMLRVTSEEYGVDEIGPYDSLQEAREAKGRVKLSADMLRDGVEREYTIHLMENEGSGR